MHVWPIEDDKERLGRQRADSIVDRALLLSHDGDRSPSRLLERTLGAIAAEFGATDVTIRSVSREPLGAGSLITSSGGIDHDAHTSTALVRQLEHAALNNNRLANCPDVEISSDADELAMFRRGGIRMIAVAPVIAGAEVIALIEVSHPDPNGLDPADLAAISAIGPPLLGGLLGSFLSDVDAVPQPDVDATVAEVVATIGHDLRTPLANIAAYIDLLRDGEAGELEEEQLHFLDVAGRNTERIIELLDGFAERYRRTPTSRSDH